MSQEATYTSLQVAKAAGMSLDNFRAQFTRDHWRLFSNDRPEIGKAHRFTFGQAMVYALARRLSEAGFTPADAFSVALYGLEQSSVDAFFGKTGKIFDETKGRAYFLAVHPHGNNGPTGQRFFSKEIHNLEALFLGERAAGEPANEKVVMVDLTAMRDRVMAELEGLAG